MVTVDGKKIVFSQSFIVRDGKEAKFTLSTPEAHLACTVVFTPPVHGEPQRVETSGEASNVKFTFTGFQNELGSVTIDPVEFLKTASNSRLYYQARQSYLDGNNFVHFFVYSDK
ncbi:DUF6864 domain-containing function [Janthinobacterium sp. LB2P49]|uniref:DUF6864 domain-containing function n=1 Tax=Janthinobacterium sp. LB2P49 TaxID=3424198 RepID=UPI003F2783B0